MAVALNASQVLILQTLAKNPKRPLDTKSLEEKSGGAVNSGNIGPVFKDVLGNYPGSLYALGMVRPVKAEGEKVVWEITSKGINAAEVYRTKKIYSGEKIPAKILDAVVKKFMPTRTYGLETYTAADLIEILEACGDEYADTPHDFLKEQIVNRRKQGAFTTDSERLKRKLEQFQRVLTEYEIELSPKGSQKLSKLLQTIAG